MTLNALKRPLTLLPPAAEFAPLLLRLHRRLSHAPDAAAVLAILHDALPALLPVRDRVSVALDDGNPDSLAVVRLLPPQAALPAELPRVRREGTVVGQVARDGIARVVGDLRHDDNLRFGRASHDGIRSTLSAPILLAGQVVGVLNAGSAQAGACRAAMLGDLEAVASIAGVALFQLLVHAPRAGQDQGSEWLTRDEHERRYVVAVLQHTGGRIEGPGGAAELLDMQPSTLRSRALKLGVRWQDARRRRQP